jgi:uncharacterized protein
MQRVLLEQRLGFVATVTPDGRPNLSPKGTTTVFDERHLMFADIVSPGTVATLASNPAVEVNVVDPIVRKGYRFKGTATVHTNGTVYDRGLAVLTERGSTLTARRVRSIVIIEVTEAAPLVSPAYDDGATEEAVTERWLRHHNELHPSGGWRRSFRHRSPPRPSSRQLAPVSGDRCRDDNTRRQAADPLPIPVAVTCRARAVSSCRRHRHEEDTCPARPAFPRRRSPGRTGTC